MIAVDTSTWIAFFAGQKSKDAEALFEILDHKQVVLPKVVLTELLSDPKLPENIRSFLLDLPLLEMDDDYWKRAGLTRAKVLTKGLKARVADALIAQSCIDHHTPLLTGDRDFRHFAPYGLELYLR